MKYRFDQQMNAASAANAAEASSRCSAFCADALLLILDAVIAASIFVLAILVRISILVFALSVILVLCLQDRENRWKTQAATA